MNSHLRKVLAFVLVLSMCATSGTLTAIAAEYGPDAEAVPEAAAEEYISAAESDETAAEEAVQTPVSITSSPEDYSGVIGSKAVFTVGAEGDGLKYHWQYKTPKGSWHNSTALTAGYKTDTIEVEVAKKRDGFRYRCVVTDAYGNKVTSSAATLTVEKLAITTQPEDYAGPIGTYAVFTVAANSDNVRYQWQYKTSMGIWRNCTSLTKGYRTDTITVEVAEKRDGFQYRCIITDGYGGKVTSSAVRLTVAEAAPEYPAITETKTAGSSEVAIDAPEGALPAGTTLEVKTVDAAEAADKIANSFRSANNISAVLALDISFNTADGEVEPAEGTGVTVTITDDAIASLANPVVYHIADNGEVSEVAATVSGSTITFTAGEFSVYVIGDGEHVTTPRATYHFLSELDEDGNAEPYTFVNKAGDLVDYQIIKGDELLQDPGQPVTGLEKNFLGWFVVEKNGETYSFPENAQPIDFEQAPPVKATTEDVDVYVAPRYGQAFIVTFWDNADTTSADQLHIVAKKVVYLDEGETYTSVTVNDVNVPSAATQTLSGWYSLDYKDERVEYTLLEKPVWDEVANSFNLYPIFSDGHWLRFSGGPAGSGAGYRTAIFVTSNTTASEIQHLGKVGRDGYTFAGWYYKGSDDNPFDGTVAATDANGDATAAQAATLLETVQNATGDTTLYAHWTGNATTYKVISWFENANDDDYSFGYSDASFEGLQTINANSGDTTNYTAPAVDGFTAQEFEQVTVNGDGSTTLNVYYKRNIYEVKFYRATVRTSWGGSVTVTAGTQYTELTISAKYGKNIHGEWPGTKEGTESYTSAWYEATGSNPGFVTGITTMPLNGHSYYEYSSSSTTWLDAVYRIQNVDGSNHFSDYAHNAFQESTRITVSATEFTAIEGFRVNAYSQANANTISNTAGGDPNAVYDPNFSTSPRIGSSFQNAERVTRNGRTYYTLYFYYLRNQYGITFNTNLPASATAPALPDMSGIYYEANIAEVKATEIATLNNNWKVGETKVTVTGVGDQIFQGWYDNAACEGEPFSFNKKMPASDIVLYAKWSKVEYLVQIDPRGGEIRPEVSEVTYTWLKYGEKLREYNIRRDFVEAPDDYTGTKYYYVSILASDDPNAWADSGAYWSGDRKGFYAKEEDLASLEAFVAAYPSYAGDYAASNYALLMAHKSDTVYMPATTNDNWAFVGWYKATVDPETHELTDTNELYTFSDDITGPTAIYAKWRRSGLFTVQYHGENGTVQGQMNGSLVVADESYADAAKTKIAYAPDLITSTDGKRYVFVGWKLADPHGFSATAPGSATLVGDLYEQGDEFTIDAEYADSGHFIHLVAVYELAEVNPDTLPVTTVTFDPNFPTGATGTGEITKIEGVPLNTAIDLSKTSFTISLAGQDDREVTIPVFTAVGYSLIGWNDDETAADAGTVKYKTTDVIGVDNADPVANTLYAVWEAVFYVFHSSDGTVDKVLLSSLSDGKYDLTGTVKSGNRYGGYYQGYFTVTDEQAIDAAEKGTAATTEIYNGSALYKSVDGKNVRFWTKGKANRTAGDDLTPKAGDIYYVKEVPEAYLTSYLQYIYNWKTDKKITNLYFVTTTDDTYYDSTWFTIKVGEGKEVKLDNVQLASKFVINRETDADGSTVVTDTTVIATTVNSALSRGYVGVYDAGSTYITAGTTFTITPHWKTLDGITVDGTSQTYTFGNGTTKDDLTKG